MIKMLINVYFNLSAGVCWWFKETWVVLKLLLHSGNGLCVQVYIDNGLIQLYGIW